MDMRSSRDDSSSLEELVPTMRTLLRSAQATGPAGDRARAEAAALARALVAGRSGRAAAESLCRLHKTLLAQPDMPGRAQTLLWLSSNAHDELADADGPAAAVAASDRLAVEIALSLATDRIRVYQADRERVDELSDAIDELRQLVEDLPSGDAERAKALTNLGVAYNLRSRTDSKTSLDDIERAVAVTGSSLDETEQNDPWYPTRVNNHGSALRARYEAYSVIADLETAVNAQLPLLEHPALPTAHRAMYANNIGQGCRELFEVTLDRSFLKRAIAMHRLAVRLARSDPNAELSRILSNAGITQRFWDHSYDGISQAIAWQREALRLMSSREAEWAARKQSLGHSLLARARVRRSVDDATGAIDEFDQAFRNDARSTAHQSGLRQGRAEAFEYRWRLTGEIADARTALEEYTSALSGALEGDLVSVFEIARAGGVLAVKAGPSAGHEPLAFLARGMQVLDMLIARQPLRLDQRRWQRHAESLAACTAVAYADQGRAHEVVETLDSFRSREISMLATYARLADSDDEDELGRLRRARWAIAEWLRQGGPANAASLDRNVVEALGEEGLADLRAMTVPTTAVEQAAATNQHVAYLVASEIGGAVAVAHPDGTLEVARLPRVTEAAVRRALARLHRAYESRRDEPELFEKALASLALWVGSRLIAPLLALVPDGASLAIIPCGPLSELPLLTAATRRPRSDQTDYLLLGRPVVFAASVQTLHPIGSRTHAHGPGVFIDGEASALTRRLAEAEVRAMSAFVRAERIDAWTASPGDLLRSCKTAGIIHIACHGQMNRADPTLSTIHTGGIRPLMIADVVRTALPNKPLVVLTSCESAAPDPVLPDQTFGFPEAILHSGADMVIASSLAVPRLASALLAVGLYAELAEAQPPHVALARTQQWIASSTYAEKARRIRDICTALNKASTEAGALHDLADLLTRLAESGRRPSLADWCLFMAHC